MAHGLLNAAGLVLNVTSLVLTTRGRRNAGRLAFLAGYSLNVVGAHLGGELPYGYGFSVNRNVFEKPGPDEVTPALRRVSCQTPVWGGLRSTGWESCSTRRVTVGSAPSPTCNHFSGPLNEGDREGDTVVCPWHKSRFDLCTGEVIEGPALFLKSRYHTRVREETIEVKVVAENV